MKYIYPLIFLFPFSIYQFSLANISVRFFDILLLIFLIFYFINSIFDKKFIIKIDLITISLLGIIFFGFVSSIIFSSNLFLSFKSVLAYLSIIFFNLLFVNNFKEKYILTLINVIIFTGLFIAIFGSFQFFSWIFLNQKILPPLCDLGFCSDFIHQSNYGAYGFINLMRIPAFFENMNQFTIYLIPSSILSLYMYLLNKKNRYLFIFLFLFQSEIIGLSRSGLICFIFALFLFFIFFYEESKNFFVNFFMVFFLISNLIYFYGDVFFFAEYLEHFNLFDIDRRSDVSNINNFLQHFEVVAKLSFENFGLGMGFQEYDNYVYDNGMVELYGSHSNFLTIFGESGLYAIIFYLFPSFLFIFFIIFYKLNNYCKLFLIIYFSTFLGGFMRTYSFNTFFILFPSLVLIFFDRRKIN